jgi:hypothetical protein
VQFGPAVLLLRLRNPVHVAQSVVSLDHMSGGASCSALVLVGSTPKILGVRCPGRSTRPTDK